MFQVRIHPISERFVLWNSQHPAMARWSPCHWLSIMGDELQFGPRHGTTWRHRTYAAHAWTRHNKTIKCCRKLVVHLLLYRYRFGPTVHDFCPSFCSHAVREFLRSYQTRRVKHSSCFFQRKVQSTIACEHKHSTCQRVPKIHTLQIFAALGIFVTGPDAADAALLVWILRPLSFGHTLMNLMRVAAIFVLVGLVCGKFCCRVRPRRQSIHCWTYWV